MTSFPDSSPGYTGDSPTQGVVRQRLQDQLDATRQLVGAAGIQDIIINTGAITPIRGTIRVDGQSSLPDTLTTINTTNLPDGSLLLIRIKDEARPITIERGSGAGLIDTHDGLDFLMNDLDQMLWLQRVGNQWFEIERCGREKEHVVGATDQPAYANSWTASGAGARFWKDPSGNVHFAGLVEKTSVAVASSTIYTLPDGYLPGETILVPIYAQVGATVEINWLQISTGGAVAWQRGSAPSSVTVSVSLRIPPFRAEA